MLGTLRRHSKSFIVYLLFAMIIIVFVFTFNTASSRRGGCTPPEVPVFARVSGENITRDTFIMGMNLLPSLLRSEAGIGFSLAAGADTSAFFRANMEDLTPESAEAMMQMLEMVYLASEEAKRMGFRMGEKDLARSMYPESFFKEKEEIGEDGITTTKKVFDEKGFHNWLTYGLHASPQEYEEFLSRVLLALKLSSFMSGVVQVDRMEAELSARAKGTTVNLEYVRFRPEDFEAEVVVGQEEIDKFLAENEAAVREWYDANPTEFHTEMNISLAGIQVLAVNDVPPSKEGEEAQPVKPTPEQMAQARERAERLLERVKGKLPLVDPNAPVEVEAKEGSVVIDSKSLTSEEVTDPFERFKEVAKRYSDHTESRDRSGIFSGSFTPEMLVAEPFGPGVDKALEGAEKGSVVGPVETEQGYWLFYVMDKQEKKDVTLEEAKVEIAERLLRERKGPELAREKAEELLKAAQEAKSEGLEALVSKISGGMSGGTKGADKAAQPESSKDGETSAEVAEKGMEAATPPEGVEEGASEQVYKQPPMKVEKTGKFHLATPGKSVPGIGKIEGLFEEAFELTHDSPVASKVYVHPLTGHMYVVRLVEKVVSTGKIPDEDLQAERENLGITRTVPYFESWLKSLRQTAIEKGESERTEEFAAFLRSLRERIEEAERRKAKKAAAAAPSNAE